MLKKQFSLQSISVLHSLTKMDLLSRYTIGHHLVTIQEVCGYPKSKQCVSTFITIPCCIASAVFSFVCRLDVCFPLYRFFFILRYYNSWGFPTVITSEKKCATT
jgi:hypothetical protein